MRVCGARVSTRDTNYIIMHALLFAVPFETDGAEVVDCGGCFVGVLVFVVVFVVVVVLVFVAPFGCCVCLASICCKAAS